MYEAYQDCFNFISVKLKNQYAISIKDLPYLNLTQKLKFQSFDSFMDYLRLVFTYLPFLSTPFDNKSGLR